ncbi:MAG: isoprenyl transferase [Verrucomicrobiia bacterium Tous-C3TDCM]|jgi:undecaprenyl diphosphate synthase|nr:MAG: isoprenyl transferase [Verrucomicrobiae bacterium Tous-C3TDCM]PAZ04295.1 MAG: isoprenyl transferase [Verrucomicrobiae bacterium AMD-G2]
MKLHNDIPQHIAIIMDGNGRWAKNHGLPRVQGHRAGAESVREAIDACKEMGVQYLTLYAFSSENWNRPEAEVSALMMLLEKFLESKLSDLMRQDVRLLAIGQLDRLPAKTRATLDRVLAKTAENTSLTLVLALSYGSREEIAEATKKIAAEVKSGALELSEISPQLFSRYLYTADIPDPDLLIRTSGEMRVSNFLLWQISYAEMIIVNKLWPEFRQGDLFDAVRAYQKRHRRFGGV